jgi:hypothetical protein
VKRQSPVLLILVLLSLLTASGNAQIPFKRSEPILINKSRLTSLRVMEVQSPSGNGSGEPNLTLSLDGRLFLTWITAGHPVVMPLFRAWTAPVGQRRNGSHRLQLVCQLGGCRRSP